MAAKLCVVTTVEIGRSEYPHQNKVLTKRGGKNWLRVGIERRRRTVCGLTPPSPSVSEATVIRLSHVEHSVKEREREREREKEKSAHR